MPETTEMTPDRVLYFHEQVKAEVENAVDSALPGDAAIQMEMSVDEFEELRQLLSFVYSKVNEPEQTNDGGGEQPQYHPQMPRWEQCAEAEPINATSCVQMERLQLDGPFVYRMATYVETDTDSPVLNSVSMVERG